MLRTTAWTLGPEFGLEHLRATEHEVPEPGPGEVRLLLRAASLNFRDLLMVRGRYDPRQPLPLVPCSDGVGVVESAGPGVDLEPGIRVLPSFHQGWTCGPNRPGLSRATLGGPLDGTLRGAGVFRADTVVPAPDHLDDPSSASLVCAGVTAWNALHAGGRGVGPGDTVAVIGTGGVSTFALQLAKACGAHVVVTSRSEVKLDRARRLGADATVHTGRDPARWGREVRAVTGGRGADLVVEVGGVGTLSQSLEAVRTGGTVAVIGVLAGRQGELDLAPVLMRSVRLQGIFVGSTADLAELCRAVEHHRLQPVVERTYPFDEAPRAFAALENAEHVGKVCIAGRAGREEARPDGARP